MSKRKLRTRATRLEPELDRRIELATKQGGFSNPSAFIRAAIGRELAGRENGVDAAEERIAASLDRVLREVRGVRLGQPSARARTDPLVLAKNDPGSL
jgi:Arc/MetJ-type ribon-helix-helix transcriptional regulator